ncbi:MAG: serine O-acetyltransferase [Candidatus Rokubacteria bacterium]|nr:serine O-acetyltransferase [Candidatus Rokubacteria bacterium]
MLARIVDAGNHAVWLYRISHWCERRSARPWRWIAYLIYRFSLMLTGADIPPTVRIGKNFSIPHPVGIVIGTGVVIGDNVKMMSGVVLGSKNAHRSYSDNLYPVVGNNVFIGANSVILGSITIGDDSIIGACTVVTNPIPRQSVVRGAAPLVEQRGRGPREELETSSWS